MARQLGLESKVGVYHVIIRGELPEDESARKALWEDELMRLLSPVGRQRTGLILEGKSVGWKLAVTGVKARTLRPTGG